MFIPKKYGTISKFGTLGTIVLTINIIYYLVTTYIYTKAVLKTEKHQAFSSVGKSNTLSWAMVPNSSAFKMIGLIMFIISNIHNNIVYFNTYMYSFVNIFLIIISTKFVHSFHVEYFGSIYCYFGAISLVIYVVYELLKNWKFQSRIHHTSISYSHIDSPKRKTCSTVTKSPPIIL